MRRALNLPRGDALLAAVLVAAGQLELWALPSLDEPLREARLGTLPFVLASTVAVGWRRRAPLATMCAVAASVALQGALVAPTVVLTEIAALLVAAYSLAAHADLRRAVAGAGVGFLSIASLAVATSSAPQDVASIALFLGAPWVAGRAVRAGGQYAARLEDLTVQLELERERSAGLAVAEERARIAREVHDILAHGIGVVALQAAGARRVLDRDPQRAREALTSIEDARRWASFGACSSRSSPNPRTPPRVRDRVWIRRHSSWRTRGGRDRPSSFALRATRARSRPVSTSRRTASCRRH